MSLPLIWVHEDRLSRENEALRAYPGAPAVFVFDDAYLRQEGYSLKRIVFLYECLLELPVEIHRGETAATLRRLREERSAPRIVTTASPNPWIRARGEELAAEALPVEAFVRLAGGADLKRFSRYWKRAERELFGLAEGTTA